MFSFMDLMIIMAIAEDGITKRSELSAMINGYSPLEMHKDLGWEGKDCLQN